MKVIFLDNDGVICLSSNWGSRHKKQKKWDGKKLCKVFDSFEDKKIDLERLHKDSKV